MRTAREADVIDVAPSREQIGDDARFGRANAARHPVIARQLQPHDEVRPARRTQRHHQVGDNARATFPIAAKFVVSPVGPGREKLVEQVPVPGGDFDAGKAARLQVQCGVRNLLDQVAYVC